LARYGWEGLESFDGLGGTEEASRWIGGDLGCLCIVSGAQQGIKLPRIEVVGSREASSRCKFDSETRVGRVLKEIRDDSGFVNRNRENLSTSIYTNFRNISKCSIKLEKKAV
jgi:hypothetical protein